jgi:predicted RNase H-like HicB family nuclease
MLRALIYRDDDCWVAHCLETDVVAEGETPTKAFENLQSLTEFQIETALEGGDLQSLFRSAPVEIHAAFATAYDQPIRRRPPKAVERFDVRALQPN